jgi:hypothetical protein
MCMSEFQVKRIILPSGKAVEIVYLQSAPGVPAVNANDENLVAAALELCPVRRRARPSDGLARASAGRWEIERRCPECEWEASACTAKPMSSATTHCSTTAPTR